MIKKYQRIIKYGGVFFDLRKSDLYYTSYNLLSRGFPAAF